MLCEVAAPPCSLIVGEDTREINASVDRHMIRKMYINSLISISDVLMSLSQAFPIYPLFLHYRKQLSNHVETLINILEELSSTVLHCIKLKEMYLPSK